MITRPLHTLVLLMFVAAVASSTACNNKKTSASNAYQAAMTEVSHDLKTMTTTYGAKQAELQKLQETDPKAAAKLITKDLLPLLDRTVASMQKASELGHKYLEVANDEDPKVLAKILHNIDVSDRQRGGFAKMRDLLAEEAALLAKGPMSQDDELRIAQGVVQAMAPVVHPN
jgi:hypothetical protein